MEATTSLRCSGDSGVRIPLPPAFAFGAERKSEGCHAGAKRRRAILTSSRAPEDYGLAGQPSSPIMLFDGRFLLRLHPRQRNL